jgi:acetyl-CoA carboxylase carboxyltransferase component
MSIALVPRRTPALPATERLGPRERLEALCDDGSLRAIRSGVASRSTRRSRLGDGVVGAAGTVAGRPVFCYAQDSGFAGGSLGEAHAGTIARVLRLARDAGAPAVGFVESGGARMDEGIAALGAYGRIFREQVAASGWIPQVTVITGVAAGGAAYSPALGDFVVMTGEASMFLTGPGVVEQVTGERVTKAELGGPRVHARNGVCHLAAPDDAAAVALVREVLAYLPDNSAVAPPSQVAEFALARDPGASVPNEPRRVYDVREVIGAFVDAGRMLEVTPRWARSMVCALARIEGRAVALVANQPRHLGGVIDAAAAEKAARFVRTCDSFGLPLVVLVDTPGFLPGTTQESQGVIRQGAGLLHAFAAATVPKVTVVLRKAYGGGYIAMNSKDLGADFTFAWPSAEIGVVGPAQAVGIIHRREIEAAGDPKAERDRRASIYAEENLSAAVAAAGGFVDELIRPEDTRDRLAWALRSLGHGWRCER